MFNFCWIMCHVIINKLLLKQYMSSLENCIHIASLKVHRNKEIGIFNRNFHKQRGPALGF